MRPAAIAPCALSPAEYDAYAPLVDQLQVSLDAGLNPSRTTDRVAHVWDWLSTRVECSQSVENEILAFFKSPVPTRPSAAETDILLACLRLVAHSRSSKHLTRDHLYIQTSPVELKVISATTKELGSNNPFQRRNEVASDPQASTSRITASRGPAPPLPTKRRPCSPSSTLPSTNPFLNSNTAPPSSSPRLTSSRSSSPISPRTYKWDTMLDTPPLPPRPESAKEASSNKRHGMVPPPPVRPSSSSSTLPPVSRMSIISSSSHAPRVPSAISPPIPPARRHSSKLLASTHISPSMSLRTSPSPSRRSASETTSKDVLRSDSSRSDLSTASHSKPGKEDVVLPVPLARSRTLGSKPPPPPKRRPESLTLDRSNPFLSHSTPSTARTTHPKPIQRAASLSSARSAPPFGTSVHPPPMVPGGIQKDPPSRTLYPFKGDLGAMLQSQATRSEEWIVKTRESMGGRVGSSRRKSGGGDREALFDGSEEEGGSEDEGMGMRRSEAARKEREREEGWSVLDA